MLGCGRLLQVTAEGIETTNHRLRASLPSGVIYSAEEQPEICYC